MILLQNPESSSRFFFFWPALAQQENASAGSSAAEIVPAHPKAGKELSRTGKQEFFVSFPSTSLG